MISNDDETDSNTKTDERNSTNSTTQQQPFRVSLACKVKITHTIAPGKEETGCLACFYAPPKLPILTKCPCFDYPEYIVNKIRASQYVYVRENSIEYNQPTLQPAPADRSSLFEECLCCGRSRNVVMVRDRVSVVYFDDELYDDVRNDTRCCARMRNSRKKVLDSSMLLYVLSQHQS